VNSEQREVIADWLIVLGAIALFVSLFLSWSHQFSPAFLTEFGSSDQLRGVPHDPTAWQVYSALDAVLALIAVWLFAVALVGSRGPRVAALGAAIVGLGIALHALGSPPTNGANLFNPALGVPDYVSSSPAAGAGETVAIAGLLAAIAGLAVSFTAD
jgi:hypothetical protein